MIGNTKEHAYHLLDQPAPGQLAAVVHLVEEEDELTEGDVQAIRRPD